MIEQASPQIIGHDEECWLTFMRRDIPNYKDRPHRPNDPKSWYKAYRKLKKEADAEMASGAERLKAAFASINQEKEQSLARQTNRVAMPTAKRMNAGWSSRGHWAPSAKTLSASAKIKRDVQDAQRARMLRERNQIKLGRQLKSASTANNPTKVAVAPRSMVEELKKKNISPPATPEPAAIRVPVRRVGASRPPLHAPKEDDRRRPREAGSGYDLIGDREARLKAMQTRKYTPHSERDTQSNEMADPGGLSLDFLEDDDLYSDHETPKAITSQSTATHLSPAPIRSARGLSPSGGGGGSRKASPRPLPAKRKTQPSLFMTSPAKRARP